jgi:hypothetical protein
VDDGSIQFPAITFCKKRMYDEYVTRVLEHLNDNQSEEEIKAVVDRYSWNRTKVFNLVSHGNDGRPCMTNSGPVAGKPCVFPFVWPACQVFPPNGICNSVGPHVPVVHTKCIPEGNIEWCSTRPHWNNSAITGKWGGCSPKCNYQVNSTENLASDDFQYLWDKRFYRLFSDDIGHCHTYIPGHRSSTGHEQKFMAFLGKFMVWMSKIIKLCIFWHQPHKFLFTLVFRPF